MEWIRSKETAQAARRCGENAGLIKELYFTPKTLAEKAAEMLHAVQAELGGKQRLFTPDRPALLVLDMQDYFLKPGAHAFIPSAPAILPRIRALAAAFAARRWPLIFTRHLNTPQDAGRMAGWWRDLIRAESGDSRISAALDTAQGAIVEKHQYDAFFETPLKGMLQAGGANQAVVCGVMAHLCCETTARSAFMHGYQVFFVVDGTATYKESFHRATLLNLAHGFATPLLAADILQALENYAP